MKSPYAVQRKGDGYPSFWEWVSDVRAVAPYHQAARAVRVAMRRIDPGAVGSGQQIADLDRIVASQLRLIAARPDDPTGKFAEARLELEAIRGQLDAMSEEVKDRSGWTRHQR